jgi:hypothetical protein
MEYISLSADQKASFWDRCRNAYYAFQMKTQPDVKRILDEIMAMREKEIEKATALEEKHNQSIDKLMTGYDKALVHSVTGATDNWRELFDVLMLNIEALPVADQIVIMRHMYSGNKHIVATQRFRQWMTNHAEAILDNLPE